MALGQARGPVVRSRPPARRLRASMEAAGKAAGPGPPRPEGSGSAPPSPPQGLLRALREARCWF